MNLQLTQPQFNSQRDFHELPDKGYQYLAQFGTSQANVHKAGTQKVFPSKASQLIEQGDFDWRISAQDAVDEAQMFINMGTYGKKTNLGTTRADTMNVHSAQTSHQNHEPPTSIHSNQSGMTKQLGASAGVPPFLSKDLSSFAIHELNNQFRQNLMNTVSLQRANANTLAGHNYNKVGASSNMSNGKSATSQPEWLSSEHKTEESKQHAQMISNNIQQWKRSQ